MFAPLSYELNVLLVNDGSREPTTLILDELARTRDNVTVLHLSRNFGHQAALTAGLEAADGDAVVSMDSDLQHPPKVVPELLAKWEQGADVVHSVREGVQEGLFKQVTSRWYYRLMRAISPTPVIARAADFRLLDRKVVEVFRTMPERARFLRGMSVWVGFPSAQVPFVVQDRRAGVTKYTLRKMVTLALDGLVSLSSLPLYIAFYVGTFVTLGSLVYFLYVIGMFFFTDTAQPGWSSLMAAMLFLSGVQINLMGVIGLYLGRIYDEVRGRPTYIVARTAGKPLNSFTSAL
ncbi:MAG: dolichol-phosphate mannosyltransferase [Myxococcota bacterium]